MGTAHAHTALSYSNKLFVYLNNHSHEKLLVFRNSHGWAHLILFVI